METPLLSRDAILRALEALSHELGAIGVLGELCVFGGTAMVLAYTARVATKDVDAIFQPAPLVRAAAERVATKLGLPAKWLNDAVKGFLSEHHRTTTTNLPQFSNLRITMPVPEYLFAMKCMAARVGSTSDDQSDIPDIIFLAHELKIEDAASALDIVAKYYPANRISPKTQFLIEGLFDEGLL